MPRRGTPTNWRATEHATALSGVLKTMQSKLLNGNDVKEQREEFLSQVVEVVIALGWAHELLTDLNHALGVPIIVSSPSHQPLKAVIVKQP